MPNGTQIILQTDYCCLLIVIICTPDPPHHHHSTNTPSFAGELYFRFGILKSDGFLTIYSDTHDGIRRCTETGRHVKTEFSLDAIGVIRTFYLMRIRDHAVESDVFSVELAVECEW